MKKRILASIISICLTFAAQAQEWSYNKKSDQISYNNVPVVNLSKQKSKEFKTYSVSNATSNDTVLQYTLIEFTDTFATETNYYFKVENNKTKAIAYIPNIPEFNMLKAIAQEVMKNNLLLPGGDVSEEAWTKYVQSQAVDFPAMYNKLNDSLISLVKVPSELAERDMRKPIEVNHLGKIGQGNKVIGYWELLTFQPKGFNASKEYCFQLKNLAGGIVCIAWVKLSGAHIFAFNSQGQRTKENWTGIDLIKENPISNEYAKIKFLTNLSTNLVRMQLL